MAARYKLEDTRPWKEGDILTAMEADSIGPTRWAVPIKNGAKYTTNWQTTDTVHWTTQYDAELAKSPARERGNGYESAQLEGPDPPYRTEIKLKLRKKKTQGPSKQPKTVAGPPPLAVPAPDPSSSPASPKTHKNVQTQPGSPIQENQKQTQQYFLSEPENEPTPVPKPQLAV
jgi:hypothetical protein